jgi:hypothetical protein
MLMKAFNEGFSITFDYGAIIMIMSAGYDLKIKIIVCLS